MLPILLSIGPVTIYSLGFFLFVGFVLAAFLIWREARSRGLPEEKVLDTLLLGTFFGIIGGRLVYVYTNWHIFAVDFSRIFFVAKYPGLSFQGALLVGGLLALFASAALGLDALLMVDLLAFGLIFASIFGYVGCFLDRCVVVSPGQILLGAGLFVICALLVVYLANKFKATAQLSSLARRYGIFLLCYLIFESISSLILEVTGRNRGTGWYFYLAGLLVVIGIFVVRYRELFSYFGHEISQGRFIANFRLPRRSAS